MKILCAFTKYQYGDPSRGTGIEFESFIPALRDLGHEVHHLDTWDAVAYPTYHDLNLALLDEVSQFHPDLVFTTQRDYEIWLETLSTLRQQGIALASWTTDDSFKFSMVSQYIAPYYDAISTTYDYRVADYQAAGVKGVCLTQWAANARWLKEPLPASACKYGVSFIGACYGPRAEMVQRLTAAGIDITCFGLGWPNGSIPSEDIPVIMRDSVISLNFSTGFMSAGGHDRQIKARTFEVPGAGGFLLTDVAEGLENAYRIGEEIAVFGDFDDLVAKIKFYLANFAERDRIANAGYIRTRDHHTYSQRLKPILDLAVSEQSRRQQAVLAPGPTAPIVPVLSMSSIPPKRLNIAEKALRSLLVTACSLVWGKKRGEKAARRITFTASRTLFKSKTFMASGLPGRLFPYV